MNKTLKEFVNKIEKTIPGFIGVSITDIESGVPYESKGINDFDIDLASAYNLEVVKAKINAIDALGLDESIKDITISLTNQTHIQNISKERDYFIYIAIDASKGNLGITKSLLEKYKVDIKTS